MVGKLIKEYLVENGIKQSFLSQKTGLSESVISDICIHDRKLDVIEYKKICDALNVPLNYFVDKAKIVE